MVNKNGIFRDFDSNGQYYFSLHKNINELDTEKLKATLEKEIAWLLHYNEMTPLKDDLDLDPDSDTSDTETWDMIFYQ